MDYVYCGSETGGRPDDIITLTSNYLWKWRIVPHFYLAEIVCLLFSVPQCTMHRMATKRIPHQISPHSICAKLYPNTWNWARYWPTVAIHLVCQPCDSTHMKSCCGWAMKEWVSDAHLAANPNQTKNRWFIFKLRLFAGSCHIVLQRCFAKVHIFSSSCHRNGPRNYYNWFGDFGIDRNHIASSVATRHSKIYTPFA